MELLLTFAQGNLTGEGIDDVGRFLVRGEYDAGTLECSWTKSYSGAHRVYYRGFREGKGIWGRWEIFAGPHGGFHIWPRIAGEAADRSEAADQETASQKTAVAAPSAPVAFGPVSGKLRR